MLSKDQLAKFVEYAKENDALILFDAAYEVFITEDDVPHTIYEIDGAKEYLVYRKGGDDAKYRLLATVSGVFYKDSENIVNKTYLCNVLYKYE